MFRSLAAVAAKPDLPVSPLQGDFEHPPSIDADRVVNQIAENSPSVRRARQDMLRAQAEIKSARREVVPDLQIRAGMQQNFEQLPELSGRRTGVQGFASAGIDLPIFNRNQGNVAAAKAGLERAEAEVSRVQLSLRQRAEPMLRDYLSNQIQAARYKNEMIPRATRAYDLYLAKYRQMGAAYPQVLVSQRTLFQLQAGYIHALENVWTNAIALENFALTSGLSTPVDR
jgi:cobalt-zinc-cadmium efflux system outer membrane protein